MAEPEAAGAGRLDDAPLPCVVAAGAVATVAFWAYTRTLLPGVDLGDSGGFQAAAVWPETSARESYPLYFALGEAFMRAVSAANPARGLNLFSAIWAALGAGLLTFVAGRVVRSAAAGAVAGLLLAFSYTYWSQAIIAEVYTLHLALVAACLLALGAFRQRPTIARLTAFFAVYAASFGNHYLMILLLPPFTIFIVLAARGSLDVFTRPVIARAAGIAVAGVLLYTGNFLATWSSFDAPPGVAERLSSFWFDITKADWRDAMVLGLADRPRLVRFAMWGWDARQQFGAAGLVLALLGAVRLWRIDRAWASLVVVAYAISATFALTYNVGDVHVFFLPAHFFAAFAAAAAVAPIANHRWLIQGLTIAALAWAGWHARETWPAVDRHTDRRADQLVSRTAQGLTDQDSVLVTALDWQSENALLYASRHDRRNLAMTRLADVFSHFPFLVADNHALGRDIVLTADAATDVVGAYGPHFPVVPDERVPAPSLPDTAARLPAGTPYVLTLLPPAGRERLTPAEIDAVLRALTGGSTPSRREGQFELWAGVSGEAPALYRSSQRPFRERFSLLGDPFVARMESWLPDDTFRRAGFGRVIRGRDPVMTIERGLSLVWFRADGSSATAYAAGLYAPRPRFVIPAQTERFALCSESCASQLPY